MEAVACDPVLPAYGMSSHLACSNVPAARPLPRPVGHLRMHRRGQGLTLWGLPPAVAVVAATGAGTLGRRVPRPALMAGRTLEWHVVALGASTPASDLVAALPRNIVGEDGGGFALLAVPRTRADELPELAKAVEAGLAAGVPLVAALSDGEKLSLGVAHGLSDVSVLPFTGEGQQSCTDRIALMEPAARTVLLFASHVVRPAAVRAAWDGLKVSCPRATVVGMVGPPPAGTLSSCAALWCQGRPLHERSITAIAMQPPAIVAIEACGFKPFGPELEVFEAKLPRGGPAVLRSIGTDEKGDPSDLTHPGCTIPRRKSLPAVVAVREAMRVAGVDGPREVWIGIPGMPRSSRTPVAEIGGRSSRRAWSLFPWAGVTPEGGLVIGGRGPAIEGLVPKSVLRWVQCFRTVLPAAGGPGLGGPRVDHLQAGNGEGISLALSTVAVPREALSDVIAKAGQGTLALVGSALIGATSTRSAHMHGRAVASVRLSDSW